MMEETLWRVAHIVVLYRCEVSPLKIARVKVLRGGHQGAEGQAQILAIVPYTLKNLEG